MMPRPSTTPLWMSVLAVLLLAAPAQAQFETPNRQFHDESTFHLDGRHRDLPCESCHVGGVYQGTPTTCFDCHWVRRQDDRFRLQLGSQCEQCHRPTAWSDVRWNHETMTGMPLGAAHQTLACQACHTSDSFAAVQTTCIACHQQDYDATRTPNHAAAGFPTSCDTCHRVSDTTFTQARFDHGAAFPLVGLHALQTCESCHRSGVFQGTPRDCAGCHLPLYERTTAPNHLSAGFPTTCQNCHRPTDASWGGGGAGGAFNHSAVFPLVGVHAQQACQSCHVNNVFAGTPRDCVGCHRPLYDRTSAPNHASAGFPTTCEDCHRPTDAAWAGGGGGSFNHSAVFPLVGRHAQQACQTCHVNNVFAGTPRDCVGCHLAAYNATTAPSHAAAGFPTSCESCHRASDTAWTDGTFNHRFPITSGPHRTTCTTCHQEPSFQTFTCLVCHEHDRSRMDEKHKERAGYRYDSLACYSCHPNGRH